MDTVLAGAPEPETGLGRMRVLSPLCGLRVSPLQLGGMSIGESWAAFMGKMDKQKSFELLDSFTRSGGNFIDTANMYQEEESERWIGEWMATRGNRDQMVIATKYTSDFVRHKIGKGPQASNHIGNHKKSMKLSLEASLRKLQTTYVDILYVHWWDWTTSIEEVMDALDLVVKNGKVLYLGISDSPAWVAAAANTYARAHGKSPFVIYQGRWNVMCRDLERDILPMARHFGMALAPWDVLAGGRMASTRQHAARRESGDIIRTMDVAPPELTQDELSMIAVLEKVASEVGVEDNVPAVAIAYVMAKSPYVFPIIGGRKVEYLAKNIEALSVRLSAEQISMIEDALPFNLGFPLNFIGPDPRFTDGVAGPLLSATSRLDIVRAGTSLNYRG